jgi:hypothetical protein
VFIEQIDRIGWKLPGNRSSFQKKVLPDFCGIEFAERTGRA